MASLPLRDPLLLAYLCAGAGGGVISENSAAGAAVPSPEGLGGYKPALGPPGSKPDGNNRAGHLVVTSYGRSMGVKMEIVADLSCSTTRGPGGPRGRIEDIPI
jgi:hypothetical protein